ncbi:MAG: LysM domain-containing protein [Legionella sp.]|jgi:hypothetical protein
MNYILLILCFLISTSCQSLSLKPNSPTRYVVQKGDTLWTIANRYLEKPWEWKQLWRANPKINNPNRLYAGDILFLVNDSDTPYIRVKPNGTIKLSPTPRASALESPVPTIPLSIIQPWLNESLVLDEDVLSSAPYIVAFMGEHMMGGQGNEVYVKGLHPSPIIPTEGAINYSIFRQGTNYVNPITGNFLGYKATLVGYGELKAGGEPATVLITDIIEGVRKLDRVLINNSPELNLYFEPQAPAFTFTGFIIDMPGGIPSGNSQEAVGQVIVISLGAENGFKPGDVIGLFNKPRIVKDPKNLLVPIHLPPERLGEAMIFRTFTKTSFALIVRSIRPIYYLDRVANP